MTLRLDDRDHTLLRLLTIVTRTSANQIITELLREELARAFPDQEDLTAEDLAPSAADLFRQATGREPPEITDEMEAAFQAAHQRAQEAARRFYGGETGERAAP